VNNAAVKGNDQQRRRVRRTALILMCVAAAFYLGFIALSVSLGHA
jgi:hypothetical protein